MEETRVPVSFQMKYLGLTVNGKWFFEEYFSRLAPRLTGAAAALRSLLPNSAGPGGRTRRLYANTVRSIALYGAPI